jgi:hypothetical protein
MGYRSAKQRHETVTQKLIDGSLIAMNLAQRQLKKAVQQEMHIFRANLPCQWGRVLKIAEENRYLLPFAFKGTPGRQDFLSQVWWRIGQRFMLWRGCWRSGWL